VVLADAGQPLRHRQQLVMYHETAEVMVELSLLEAEEVQPGQNALAQLFAAGPVVAMDGDRFILRVPSPPATVAGGVIIDRAPRRHRRRDPAVLKDLALREHADPATAAVLELGKHPWGLPEAELADRLALPVARLAEVMRTLAERGAVRRLASTWLTRDRWEALVARVSGVLRDYHLAHPLRRGMPREELRSRSGFPAELYGGALVALVDDGVVTERGGEVAAIEHRQGLNPEQEAAVGAFIADLERQPFNPPPLANLMLQHGLTPALLEYLVAEERVVRVNDDTVFARSAYDDAVGRLRSHLTQNRTLTVAGARDLLGSSRRYVLPLLEWLDAQKVTRRVGDDRILRP